MRRRFLGALKRSQGRKRCRQRVQSENRTLSAGYAADRSLLSGGDRNRSRLPLAFNPVFYIARNTLAVTGSMSKKAALTLWEERKGTEATDGALYQLCKATPTSSVNPVVVMDLA